MSYLTCQLKHNDRSRDGVRYTAGECGRTYDGVPAWHDRLAPNASWEPHGHAFAHQPTERRTYEHM